MIAQEPVTFNHACANPSTKAGTGRLVVPIRFAHLTLFFRAAGKAYAPNWLFLSCGVRLRRKQKSRYCCTGSQPPEEGRCMSNGFQLLLATATERSIRPNQRVSTGATKYFYNRFAFDWVSIRLQKARKQDCTEERYGCQHFPDQSFFTIFHN